MRLHVLEGATYQAGTEFASLSFVVPVVLDRLGASRTVVGLVGSMFFLGLALQVFAVPRLERSADRKRPLVILGVFMRAPFLLMAACVFALAGPSPTLCLWLLLSCLLINSISLGITIPAWMDLVSRTFPESQRGRLLGYRHGLGGALCMGVGLATRAILKTYGFPNGYALLFLMAFILTSVSWLLFVKVLEVPSGGPRPQRLDLSGHVSAMMRLLRRDRPTRRLIVARSFLQAARASELFFAVSAIERLSLGDDATGVFLLMAASARTASGLIFSQLTDRLGHRRTMAAGSVLCAGGSVLAALASSYGGFLAVFVLSGFIFGMVQTAQAPLTMSLAPAEGRVGFYSLLLLAQLPVSLVSQVGGGALADIAGYPPFFWATATMGVAAAAAILALPDRRAETTA